MAEKNLEKEVRECPIINTCDYIIKLRMARAAKDREKDFCREDYEGCAYLRYSTEKDRKSYPFAYKKGIGN